MGRINYGSALQDPKGIVGNVTLDKMVLSDWSIYPLDLDPVVKESVPSEFEDKDSIQIPSFYTGTIPPSPDGTPRDTFLKLPGWFKVCADFKCIFLRFRPLSNSAPTKTRNSVPPEILEHSRTRQINKKNQKTFGKHSVFYRLGLGYLPRTQTSL